MRKPRSHRLNHATVVAYVALFAAVGGTGYAAVTIDGKNIRNRSVAGRKLKRSTVTSIEVRDQSLLARDFKAGQLPSGPRGAQGPKGDTGPKGEQGATGPAGISGYEIVKGALIVQASGTRLTQTVDCPANKRAVGGGAAVSNVQQSIGSSHPVEPDGTAWTVTLNNNSGASQNIQAYAVCVAVTG